MLTAVIPELAALPSYIDGARIRLRPYGRGDGPGLFRALDDSRTHLQGWLPWVAAHKTPIDSEVYARKACAWWILRDNLPMCIETADRGIIGGTGFHRLDWATRSFEIGYWITKDAEGQGLVSEAVELLCGVAFERLDATRVQIHCLASNRRSAAIPRRLGFSEESRFEPNTLSNSGEMIDILWFTLTRPMFDALPWSERSLAYTRRSNRDG